MVPNRLERLSGLQAETALDPTSMGSSITLASYTGDRQGRQVRLLAPGADYYSETVAKARWALFGEAGGEGPSRRNKGVAEESQADYAPGLMSTEASQPSSVAGDRAGSAAGSKK